MRLPRHPTPPILILHNTNPKKQLPITNQLPQHIQDLQTPSRPASLPLCPYICALDTSSQFLSCSIEILRGSKGPAAAAELGGHEGAVCHVADYVVVAEADVGFPRRVDEVGAAVAFWGGGERGGFDDGEVGQVVADVDAVCEVVVGVFDEDWAGEGERGDECRDGVDGVQGWGFGVVEMKEGESGGGEAREEGLEGGFCCAVLDDHGF